MVSLKCSQMGSFHHDIYNDVTGSSCEFTEAEDHDISLENGKLMSCTS